MSPVSVQLYSVRDAFAADPARTMRRLAEIGFTQVEPYGVVENAEALRAGLLANIEPHVDAARWHDADGVAATARALNEAAEVAAGYGITVGYHNHWWEPAARVGGRSAFEVFAEQLAPGLVLEVDTYWATAAGEHAPTLLRKLGERVRAIHVKDGALATDGSGQVPAGQGRVPVAEVLAAAPHALRVIEFDAYAGDIFDGLAAGLAYVRGQGR
ncbi:TIM barrel protein [Actinoplanes sp. NPDC049316]|uniref:sugar phosphate isomerase/epimerase family protein n=1 Tax=Actinoplanes sp. NPDC049316 TaxID=3154727 RepID=UPI003430BEC2